MVKKKTINNGLGISKMYRINMGHLFWNSNSFFIEFYSHSVSRCSGNNGKHYSAEVKMIVKGVYLKLCVELRIYCQAYKNIKT